MPRRKKKNEEPRAKLNLTMHPDVRYWAEELCFRGRRSLSRLFEDLVEAEWQRMKSPPPPAPAPAPQAQPPFYYYPQPYPHYYAAPQGPQQPQQ